MTPKIKITQATTWQRALNAARRTVGKAPLGKEPSDEWKHRMLLAEHSPIRLVEYDISFAGIRQWVTVHLVRHFMGFIPFVHSQREDRRKLDCSRDDLPQGALNDMDCTVNAQALINVSRRRLCACASKETREAWQAVKDEMRKVDPVMARHMVRNCIYRGFCPEPNGCGYDKTKQFINELNNYRNGKEE